MTFTTSAQDEANTTYIITVSTPAVEGKYTAASEQMYFVLTEDPQAPGKLAVDTAYEKIKDSTRLTAGQSSAETADAACGYVKSELDGLIDDRDVRVEIIHTAFSAAVPGDAENINGENGFLDFNVVLISGEYSIVCTEEFTLDITAKRYMKDSNTALSSLKYRINGGRAENVALNDASVYGVTLYGLFADGTAVELIGEAESSLASVSSKTAYFYLGLASAELTVTAEDGTKETYKVNFTTSGGINNGIPGGWGTGSSPIYPGSGIGTGTLVQNNGYTSPSVEPTVSTAPNGASGEAQVRSDGCVVDGKYLRYATGDRSLVPYYTDDSGNEVVIPICGYEDGALIFMYDPENPDRQYRFKHRQTVRYSDISSHWAYNYITEVSGMSIFIGTSNGTYSPNMQMTYGMFITVLGRMSGEYIDTSGGYRPYITWADRSGITSGVPIMSENDPVNRETAAVLLAAFAEYMGAESGKGSVARYLDAHTISPWAKDSVGVLTYEGIITGRDTGDFDPHAYLTRAETAVLITRIIPYILDNFRI